MHLLYIVFIDISIQKKIAFIAILHHFILLFLILFIASIYFNVPNRIASFISLYRLNYLPKNQPIGKLPIISNSCIINLHSFINKLITRAILKIITSTSCNARLNCLNLCIISIKNL